MAERSYIAFISYRHRPLDIQVASSLQRMIERYRIPGRMRSDLPGRRLGYVFRDRDELSVSEDLSAAIREALDHSRFLIVICTPDTPGSEWVRREIRYFIERNGRKRVLAVLAAGTPETSFPPELMADENGKRAEPMAANVCGEGPARVRSAMKREKLRIVSTLIGCRYDDLVQRDRVFRRRRMAIAVSFGAAVAAAFIGMLLLKNREITLRNEELVRSHEEINERAHRLLLSYTDTMTRERTLETELTEAKRRENELRCGLAQATLRLGDVREALRLSVEAAESAASLDERGCVRAETVLSEALCPYGYGEACLEAIVELPSEPVGHVLSADGTMILVRHGENALSGLDAATGECRWTVGNAGEWLAEDGLVFTVSEGRVHARDPVSGELLWQAALFLDAVGGALVSPGDDVLALTGERTLDGSSAPAAIFLGSDGTAGGTFVFSGEERGAAFSRCPGCFDGSGDSCFFCLTDVSGVTLCRLDISRAEPRLVYETRLDPAGVDVLELRYLPEDDRLLAVAAENAEDSSLVFCLADAGSGALLGRSSVRLGGSRSGEAFSGTRFTYASGGALCLVGDRLIFVDTGDLESRICELPAEALLAWPDASGGFSAVLADGSLIRAEAGADGLSAADAGRPFPGLASALAVGGGLSDPEGGALLCLPASHPDSLYRYALRRPPEGSAVAPEAGTGRLSDAETLTAVGRSDDPIGILRNDTQVLTAALPDSVSGAAVALPPLVTANGWAVYFLSVDRGTVCIAYSADDDAWHELSGIPAEKPVSAAADSSGGFTVLGEEGGLWACSPSEDRILWSCELPRALNNARSLLCTPCGRFLVAGGEDGSFAVFNASTGELILTEKLPAKAGTASLQAVGTEDQTRLYVYPADGEGQGMLLDMDSRTSAAVIPGLCGYLPEERRLLIRESGTHALLSVPEITLEDLTAEAKRLLGIDPGEPSGNGGIRKEGGVANAGGLLKDP